MQTYAAILGVGAVAFLALRQFKKGGVCSYKKDLTGKVVIITGSNTGIGLETAKSLAEMNATIILANRPSVKSNNALETVKKSAKTKDNIYGWELDLSDFASIRAFSKKFIDSKMKCNILINNAGVMMCPYSKTAQGLELQVGTNHVGHFLLTTELLPVMEDDGRIVNVSSDAHLASKALAKDVFTRSEKDYNSLTAYANSKLANVLFTSELQRRLEEKGSKIKTVSLHPGVVATELTRHFTLGFLIHPLTQLTVKTPLEGAQTNIFGAVAPEIENWGGKYLKDCALGKISPIAQDKEAAKQLWDLTEEIIKEVEKKSS